jgi:hypothetical protein
VGGSLFRDPWKARDEYIEVVLNQGRNRREFLDRNCGRHPRPAETVRALNLLEMQRAAMLMYTSCGWFFADISGIETVQVMKYAGRVLDFMDQLELNRRAMTFSARWRRPRVICGRWAMALMFIGVSFSPAARLHNGSRRIWRFQASPITEVDRARSAITISARRTIESAIMAGWC